MVLVMEMVIVVMSVLWWYGTAAVPNITFECR